MTTRSAAGLLFGLVWVALVATISVPPLLATTKAAEAQQDTYVRRSGGGGLFDRLFGRREQVVEPAPAQRTTPRATRRNRPRAAAAGAPATAAPAESKPAAGEKLENARTVLVVGDFMAGGLADGLEEAFAGSPGIRIASRANGSSGFVRDDYYNWPAEIGGILEEEKPTVVLVMIGSNDRQQLTVDGQRESVRSEAWMKEYEARARKFAETIKQSGAPLMWVGMPAFKVSSMSADMVAFNDVYRSVAEEVGGEFIDIWDGFVDENGAFASIGPDINGQRVRLRGSDGINMTKAGKRKIAFYAEKSLNRLLGGATAPGIASLSPSGASSAFGLNPAEIERTPPIALSDPELDGTTDLLGAPAAVSREQAGMPVEQLVRHGIAPAGKPGRADDFSSAPAAAAPATAPASTETTATIPD